VNLEYAGRLAYSFRHVVMVNRLNRYEIDWRTHIRMIIVVQPHNMVYSARIIFCQRARPRVRDYLELKKRCRNYLITFRIITPLKLNPPSKKIILSFQIIDLEFVYLNLLFKVFYDDYWDYYKYYR